MDKSSNMSLTPYGIAIYCAIENGLLPKKGSNWDDTKFKLFWEKFEYELKNQGYLLVNVGKNRNN